MARFNGVGQRRANAVEVVHGGWQHGGRVLEEAGLIVRRVEGAKRPCRLAPEAFAEMDAWLAMMRTSMETNYARLDTLLEARMGRRKGKKS